uniref:Interleukin-6 receptor subunit beta n=1 Tax=Plethodon shermani TaxID=263671 RepID=D2DWL5_9SALA|nr:interleukin-6 signal transducer [Plethodon shermani]
MTYAIFVPLVICFLKGAELQMPAATVPFQRVKSCAHIIPESPFVKLGSQFTAYCILNETCISHYDQDASNIIWKVKQSKIPEEQYTTINRTVSSVTLNVTSALDSFLTCNVLVYGQLEQSLYGISLTVGHPPDKPEDFACIAYPVNDGIKNLTCTWNPGQPTLLSTTYTLRTRWSKGGDHVCVTTSANNTCTINDVNFYINTEIWVEAENALGKVESERIHDDPVNLAQFRPPRISNLTCYPDLPNSIQIEWENPSNLVPLKYIIRYRSSNTAVWDEVPPEDTASRKTSFQLQGLQPYTEYTISLRCMKEDGAGYWSDWSAEKSVITTEAKPIKGPDLWQGIISNTEGKTHVRLKWKELDRTEANGKVLGYRIKVTSRISRISETFNTTDTILDVILANHLYDVTLTAYNSVAESPKSVLSIKAGNSGGLPPVKNVRVFPEDKKLRVEWNAPNASVKGYVIEWYLCSSALCSPCQWQREPKTSRGAYLRGVLEERKLYLIKVYPLYSTGVGEAQSIKAYLEQGPPSKAPDIRTKNMGKTEVTLVWDPIPLEDRNGFITKYTILYRQSNGNDSFVDVLPNKTEYTLSSLSGDTQYRVCMRASTEKGDTDGQALTFTTSKFAKGEIEAIVVPSCIGVLIVTLLGITYGFSKRDLIKKHIWPNIPDPSKSTIVKMSPHTPTRHNFSSKNQAYPEESFTDVSVVEITTDDKKSFSEQDLKPLDLLRKEMNTSEGHSSGIGGSSCMSSPRQSVSDSEDSESTQTTSSTVQYSTVVLSGYRDQKPTPPVHAFSRSESTQPLLESEERPEDQQPVDVTTYKLQSNQYFKQNCGDERNPEGSQYEQSKNGLQFTNQEDGQLPFSGTPAPASGVFSMEDECSGNVLAEDQVSASSETLESESTTCGEPKSYLPQVVRKGGYMPQ